MAIALSVCLGTILWCIYLSRRQQNGLDKSLTGLLGLISIYEALRVLKDSGLVFHALRQIDDWTDLVIAASCLVAVLFLKWSSLDRTRTKACLRLAEANERMIEPGSGPTMVSQATHAVFDSSPLATYAVNADGDITYWNAAAEHLLGWKREEILGHKPPFADHGGLKNRGGREIEAAVWTAPICAANGIARARVTILADAAALEGGGVAQVSWLTRAHSA
jgi:PAS domain-containing protein